MSSATPLPEKELFQSTFDWFLGHVESLALDPISCYESQGNYNVAHELWYFIRKDQLANVSSERLSTHQWAAVEDLCRSVANVPEFARRWTTLASESLENMENEAWVSGRAKARHLLTILSSGTAELDHDVSESPP